MSDYETRCADLELALERVLEAFEPDVNGWVWEDDIDSQIVRVNNDSELALALDAAEDVLNDGLDADEI